MLQFDELPQFRGDESPEDAEKWLKGLVTLTGSFSDSGILRFLSTHISEGHPAMEWYESLDEDLKTSWTRFQRQFRERWIRTPILRRQQAVKWDAFRSHILTYEMMFVDGYDIYASHNVMTRWVEDHLRLRDGADQADSVLIETTEHLLPGFIRAHLHVYCKPRSVFTFYDYCSTIRDIPRQVVELEGIRHQKSMDDWRTDIDKKIGAFSQRIDDLSAVLETSGIHNTSILSLSKNTSDNPATEGASICWEVCSPLTSVASMEEHPIEGVTEAHTPVSRPVTLLNPSEANSRSSLISNGSEVLVQDVDDHVEVPYSPFQVPSHWRKPSTSSSAIQRIEIARQAINYIMTFDKRFTTRQGYVISSAVALFSTLTERRIVENTHIHGVKYPVEDWGEHRLLSGITEFYKCRLYGDNRRMQAPIKIWSEIAEGEPGTFHSVVHEKSKGMPVEFHLKPSGEPTVSGGVFSSMATRQCPSISSSRTVLFMLLSSYMAEHTGETKYQEAAILSASFVLLHLLVPGTSLMRVGTMNAKTGQWDGAKITFSYRLTGLVIEAFSVLAYVTGKDSWRARSIDIALAAMRAKMWHDASGIFATDRSIDGCRGILCRGLLVAYERNPSNRPFRNMIRGYVNVQFHALVDLARHEHSYGANWRGPYIGPDPVAQMDALDVLIAAIGVND